MDGETFGPYSAKEVRDLQLMDDILVTEESMNEWLPAGRFDFDDMVRKELGVVGNDCVATVDIPQCDTSINQMTNTIPSVSSQTVYTCSVGIPNEITGWNWGAFFFSWLWGAFNGVYWPLVLIAVNFIPYVGGLISLGGSILLGIKGSEWAWKAKNWSSVAEFKRVQRKWAIAILWVLGVSVALSILFCVFFGIIFSL